MSAPMKQHFTKLLGARRSDLINGLDRTVDHMNLDPADRVSQEEELALELRNRDRERHLIR